MSPGTYWRGIDIVITGPAVDTVSQPVDFFRLTDSLLHALNLLRVCCHKIVSHDDFVEDVKSGLSDGKSGEWNSEAVMQRKGRMARNFQSRKRKRMMKRRSQGIDFVKIGNSRGAGKDT